MVIDMFEARVRLDRLHEAQARAAQFRDDRIRGWAVAKGYIYNWDLSGEIPESMRPAAASARQAGCRGTGRGHGFADR